MLNLIASAIFLIVTSISLLPWVKNPALADNASWRGGNFVDAKNITQNDSSYRDPVNGAGGQRLRLRATAINDGTVNAMDAKVKFNLTSSSAPSAELSAANASTVIDSVSVVPGGSSLNYVAGSAKKYGPACPSGCSVGDEITSSGVSFGDVAPGAAQSYQFSIEADVVGGTAPAQMPAFRSGNIFDGGNRTSRTSDWGDPIAANPGEVVEFRIQVINDGQAAANDTQLKVILPDVPSTNLAAKAFINGAGAVQVSDTATVNVSGNTGELLEFIPGHTKKFGPGCNTSAGCPLPDSITTSGISLGSSVNPGVTNSFQVAFKVHVTNIQAAASPSPSPMMSPSPSPSPSPSMTPSPTPTPAMSPSPSPSPTMSPSPTPSPVAGQAQFAIRKFNDLNRNGIWDGNEGSTGIDWHFQYRLNDGDWHDYTVPAATGWGDTITVDLNTKVEVKELTQSGWTNTTGLTMIQILSEQKVYYFDFGNFQIPAVVSAAPPSAVPAAGTGGGYLPWFGLAAVGVILQLAAFAL